MPRTLVCGGCGRTFECEAATDCWCAAVLLRSQSLGKIGKESNDCLCKDCLSREEQAS
ncbi:MAG: cysteine-rich CWC family protein [Nitrososphaerales archaeon]